MMDLHVLLAQGTLAAQLHMFRPFEIVMVSFALVPRVCRILGVISA